MNVPAPKFLIEKTWEGRVFGAGWRPAAGGSLDVLEPATGNKITSVGNATAKDVRQRRRRGARRAARLGRHALREARRNPAQGRPHSGRQPGRADPLDRARDRRHSGQGRLRNPSGDGNPLSLRRDVHRAARLGAALRSRPHQHRPPRCRAASSASFRRSTFPLILSMRAVAPALATGNAVVLKPDPRTAMTGGFIIARMFEEAGLPKGVLHVLPGGAEAGEAICTDPDIAMVVIHRFEQRRAAHRRTRRQASQESAARTRRQERRDRARRCRSRRGGFRDRVRRLVPSGPDLHDHRPRAGAGQDRGVADRQSWWRRRTTCRSAIRWDRWRSDR